MLKDGEVMRALTLWQPWASLIVFGQKRVENRPWKLPYSRVGRPFAIHAGLRYDDEAAKQFPDDVAALGHLGRMHGAIIGTARAISCHGNRADFPVLQRRWFFGPFGWMLDRIWYVDPIVCRGREKFWTIPEHAIGRIPEHLRAAEFEPAV